MLGGQLEQNARRFAGAWQELSAVRKGMLAGTGFALVAILYLLYSWSASTSFITLYSQLDPSDSGQIVDQLRGRGIDFELEQGGSTVRVPESVIDELRVDFAAQGLPEGGHVGFEIFEGNAFTATDFVQRLNFQRGAAGCRSHSHDPAWNAFTPCASHHLHVWPQSYCCSGGAKGPLPFARS